MRASLVTSAVVAVLVGYFGTLAIILAAAQATGADHAQAVSWVVGLCLAMAGTATLLSAWKRIPIVTAWSTPGAAILAASTVPMGMDVAVGAFLLAGALLVLTAGVKPLGDLVARIPGSIASAMLAGVLLRFVLAVFESAQHSPLLVLPLIGVFLAVRLFSPVASVIATLVAGVALASGLGLVGPLPPWEGLPSLTFIAPRFDATALLGVGIPLYLVTMASQNLPGFAVLRAAGYEAPVRPILTVTGIASMLSALVGAHTSNLAAITAALCTGPDTHPDPTKRWMVGPWYGATYLLFAGLGGWLVGLFAALPGDLVRAVAGVALMSPLTGALAGALSDASHRFPAMLTLAVTASGFTMLGVGSAFWGLAAGILAFVLEDIARRLRPS
jgi:benzoate membrane transport protein